MRTYDICYVPGNWVRYFWLPEQIRAEDKFMVLYRDLELASTHEALTLCMGLQQLHAALEIMLTESSYPFEKGKE